MFSTKSFTRIFTIVTIFILVFSGVHLAYAAPPANDYFADAEVINSLPFNATVDITEAGVEPNEPESCFVTDRTAWYSFTPTETMSVRITIGGSAKFSNVSVFIALGPDISDLSIFWCPLYNPAPHTLEAGQTYYIRVGAYPGEVGTIQINIEQVFPPPNDDFVNAAAIISLPFSTTVDVTNAALEPGEGRHCSMETLTVWYSFTPTENMLVRADTLGSIIGSQVTIYSTMGGGISDLSFIGCVVYSSFSFAVEVGQTYYFQVGNIHYGEAGTIQFNLAEMKPPPVNDNFSNAELVTSLPFSATVDVSDATTETDEQQWCYWMDRTVWYSFSPTETIEVRADSQGSMISSNMNIYLAYGPGISDLNVLACTAIYGPFTFIAEEGQTYYLQAGGIGEGTITIEIEAVSSFKEVSIDIKPGSDPNSINCNNAYGVIPVAILTTDTFDATTVDHTTVTFEGASETHVNKKTGEAIRHVEDVDLDGDMDLVFHFHLGDTALTCESTEGTLTGETYDGMPIEGSDSIRMINQESP